MPTDDHGSARPLASQANRQQTRRRQATVAAFDSGTGAGRVLLDDGVVLAVPSGALRPGSARLLRRGQRVVIEVDDDAAGQPVVRLVHLLTVPPDSPAAGAPGQAGSAASTTDEPPRTR